MDCLVIEAGEIWLHVNNCNTEEVFRPNQTQNCTIRLLQQPGNGKDRARWSKEDCEKKTNEEMRNYAPGKATRDQQKGGITDCST
jgi:hypothetical protein